VVRKTAQKKEKGKMARKEVVNKKRSQEGQSLLWVAYLPAGSRKLPREEGSSLRAGGSGVGNMKIEKSRAQKES